MTSALIVETSVMHQWWRWHWRKLTMVNSSVTPNFPFTMVNLTLVSCPDNSDKNKVDLAPDNNLVPKKRGAYISWLSKPCLFWWQFVIFWGKSSNYNTFVDSYFVNMKFIFPLTRACVWANMDFNSANSSSFTSFPKGSKEPVIIHFLKPSLWSRVTQACLRALLCLCLCRMRLINEPAALSYSLIPRS